MGVQQRPLSAPRGLWCWSWTWGCMGSRWEGAWEPHGRASDVGVLTEFGGAEGEARIGWRGDVGVRGEEGLELALWMQGRRGQQTRVEPHRHLVDDVARSWV